MQDLDGDMRQLMNRREKSFVGWNIFWRGGQNRHDGREMPRPDLPYMKVLNLVACWCQSLLDLISHFLAFRRSVQQDAAGISDQSP